jgi:hypothetical protein
MSLLWILMYLHLRKTQLHLLQSERICVFRYSILHLHPSSSFILFFCFRVSS